MANTTSDWGTKDLTIDGGSPYVTSDWGTINLQIPVPRFYEFRMRVSGSWKLMRMFPL
jgi:hypothetical protein